MNDGEVQRIRNVYARRPSGDRYDLAAPDVQALDAHRRRVWAREVRCHGDVHTVLEVGAGAGVALGWMAGLGPRRLVGVDLIATRLRSAWELSPGVIPVLADGRRLPLPDRSVDAVVCSTVFSSILDEGVARDIAAEVDRVLRPEGMVLWFDFMRSNPRNPDVRKVTRGDLLRWFPRYELHLERVVLAPPLARPLRRWPRLISVLEVLPPLRTHLAGSLRRRS